MEPAPALIVLCLTAETSLTSVGMSSLNIFSRSGSGRLPAINHGLESLSRPVWKVPMQHKRTFFFTIDIELNVWSFLTIYQRSMWLNSLTDLSHFIGILHAYNLQTLTDHQNLMGFFFSPFLLSQKYSTVFFHLFTTKFLSISSSGQFSL